MIKTLKDITARCDKIRIYGAGKRGRRILGVLTEAGLKPMVDCFVVANPEENAKDIEGIPVKGLRDLWSDKNILTLISLADRMETHRVMDQMLSLEYGPFDKVSDQFFPDKDWNVVNAYFAEQEPKSRLEVMPWEEPGFCHVRILDDTGRFFYLWRYYYKYYPEIAEENRGLFPARKLLEAFEEHYGKYRILSREVEPYLAKGKLDDDSNVRVYMARHAGDTYSVKVSAPDWVIPIQVGAALSDQSIADVKDDDGENISFRNSDFSECTALYWIWKNAPKTDYVGLCHYSRRFDIRNEEIRALKRAGVDIVVTTPMFSGGPIRGFFVPWFLLTHDWDQMEESILRHFPEYAPTLDTYHEAFCYPGANLSIMRWDIFQEYASFCDAVMRDIVDYYEEKGILRQDRYAGYLMENLTALFTMHNKDKYKICFTDFLYVKP